MGASLGSRRLKPAVQRYNLEQKAQVLQVATAPAAVTQGIVDKGAGGFLKTACDTGQKPHSPARPAQKARLDEIMAQDQVVAPLCGQMREACTLCKGARPDDGVVALVIAFGAGPKRKPFGQKPAVGNVGELLKPGKQCFGPDQHREGLDQPRIRVR